GEHALEKRPEKGSLQLLPAFPKRPCGRSGKVAYRGPAAARTGQPGKPASSGERPQQEAGTMQSETVEPGTPQHSLPGTISQAFPAIPLGVVLQLPQADEHAGDMDLHGACRLAGAA